MKSFSMLFLNKVSPDDRKSVRTEPISPREIRSNIDNDEKPEFYRHGLKMHLRQ